ncbi:MAG: heme-binding protein [Nitrosomonadales bacterium]|nr:heme-binding protein [Nitrosomonadales bacterium]
MKKLKHVFLTLGMVSSLSFMSLSLAAQVSYGANINLTQAKQVADAAVQEAKRMNLNLAIAIVDTAGHLVYYEKADDTQTASADISIAKARSASNFRRSTKVFEDAVANGRIAVLGLPGAVPIEGGIPIVVNQKIIGAIGISGGTSEEDGLVEAAALKSIK